MAGTAEALYVYSSHSGKKAFPIELDIHVLSNVFLNTSWPKAERIKKQLAQSLVSRENTFRMLLVYHLKGNGCYHRFLSKARIIGHAALRL